MLTEEVVKKWKPIVEKENEPKIRSTHMKSVVYKVLANTQKELDEATQTGDVAQYTPVLISLIRRTLPTLIGNELVGVQAMQAPTGRIFCQRVWYGANKSGGTETWTPQAPAVGNTADTGPDSSKSGTYTTANGEALGWNVTSNFATTPPVNNAVTDPAPWPEMSFSIDSVDVSVNSRAMKGKLTTEVISDLRAVHGLDAEQEIANILQQEVVAEIDREIITAIYNQAKAGAQNCGTPGTFNFDSDADGRWGIEKAQGLLIQIEREAVQIARETRRGRGNFIVTSADIAAYLSMAAKHIESARFMDDFQPEINTVGISYFGTIGGRFRVYVDPYLATQTVVVGYKGANAYDAGLFYCPYIPLQFMKATGPEDFGLRLGIKSRYGLVANPYMHMTFGGMSPALSASAGKNAYYRKFTVTGM